MPQCLGQLRGIELGEQHGCRSVSDPQQEAALPHLHQVHGSSCIERNPIQHTQRPSRRRYPEAHTSGPAEHHPGQDAHGHQREQRLQQRRTVAGGEWRLGRRWSRLEQPPHLVETILPWAGSFDRWGAAVKRFQASGGRAVLGPPETAPIVSRGGDGAPRGQYSSGRRTVLVPRLLVR